MVQNLSASSLILHRTNPRRWCLQYIEGLKEIPSDKAAFGTHVHTMLENYYKYDHWTYDPTLVSHNTYRHIRKAVDIDGPLLPRYVIKKEEMPNTRTEWYFNKKVTDLLPPLRGYIDMWGNTKHRAKLWDYKTTSSSRYLKKKTDLITDWQLGIYGWAIGHELNKSIPVSVSHIQLVRNAKGDIDKAKEVQVLLTQNMISDTMNEVRKEMMAVCRTIESYRRNGLRSIRETPEHRWWYGKEDAFWPILTGQITVEQFKKYWNQG